MTPTKKNQQQIIQVYDKWLYGYLIRDVKTYDSHFDNAHGSIGTTQNANFLDRSETTWFLVDTAAQIAVKCELRNETLAMEQLGDFIFIAPLFDTSFNLYRDRNFDSRFRFISAFDEKRRAGTLLTDISLFPMPKLKNGNPLGLKQTMSSPEVQATSHEI